MAEIQPYKLVVSGLAFGLCPKEVGGLVARERGAALFGPLVLAHFERIGIDGLGLACGVVSVDVDGGSLVLEINVVRRNPAVGGLVEGVVEVVGPVASEQQLARLAVHPVNYERADFVAVSKAVLACPGGIFLVDMAAQSDGHLNII